MVVVSFSYIIPYALLFVKSFGASLMRRRPHRLITSRIDCLDRYAQALCLLYRQYYSTATTPNAASPIVHSDSVIGKNYLWCGGRGTLGNFFQLLRSATKLLLIAQSNSPPYPSWIALNSGQIQCNRQTHIWHGGWFVPLLLHCLESLNACAVCGSFTVLYRFVTPPMLVCAYPTALLHTTTML